MTDDELDGGPDSEPVEPTHPDTEPNLPSPRGSYAPPFVIPSPPGVPTLGPDEEENERADLDRRFRQLTQELREANQEFANPFLEKFEAWRKGESARIDDHEVRLVEVEKLKGVVEQMQRQLDDVKRQLADLVGDGK